MTGSVLNFTHERFLRPYDAEFVPLRVGKGPMLTACGSAAPAGKRPGRRSVVPLVEPVEQIAGHLLDLLIGVL